MIKLLQVGSGDRRPLFLAYGVQRRAPLLMQLPKATCIVVDDDASRYPNAVGAGGVDPIASVVAAAHDATPAPRAVHAPPAEPASPPVPFTASPVVLFGSGAGCAAIRQQIRAGAAPDVVVCLDALASGAQADPAPWSAAVRRAREGSASFVFAYTGTRETEKIAEAIFGTAGVQPTGPSFVPVAAALYVLRYPADTVARYRFDLSVLPDVLSHIVVPQLRARAAS